MIPAVIIGAQAGAALGLILLGSSLFLPLATMAAGAGAGLLAHRVWLGLVRRGLRRRLRAAPLR